jgi:hypothetical protein
MCPAIDNPAAAKFALLSVFFMPKSMSITDIHRELCVVYGQNGMSEGTVGQWYRTAVANLIHLEGQI